ncbi:MAG: hypothetical protein DRQ88_11445 [Epsilonproteobacteria bacterium]|nr:MAG: hypothetical protein DRQ88_11445 [Campylobacterota bacterium]
MKRLTLFAIIFLTSCSLFIKNEKSDVEKALKKNQAALNYCPIKRKANQLLGASENFVKSYRKLVQTLRLKKIHLSFIDRYVVYALMQMNSRPDQASPTSRHQVFIGHRGKDYYFDFFAKKSPAYPFLFGLDGLLKAFSSRYSLKRLGGLIDRYQKEPILVSQNFYSFLKQNKKILKKSNLKNYYLKAGQILHPGESIPKLKLKSIIAKYYKNKKNVGRFKTLVRYIPSEKSKINTSDSNIHCNIDLNLYNRPLYLSKGAYGDSANFGLFDEGSVALGVTSQALDTLQGLWGTNLFQGTGTGYQARFCKITRKENKMIFISSKGKDPGQHLSHFLKRNAHYIDSFKNVDDLITSARYLHLVDPLRIIYESRRGSKLKLNMLRKEGYPLYHSSNLGYIWAWGKFGNLSSLFRDPRAHSFVSCPETEH